MSNVSTGELRSQADCTLFTYGVGDHQTETYPPYFLNMAKENPDKTYLMVHCDPHLPLEKVEERGNLTIKHIKKSFRLKLEDFQKIVEERLNHSGTVFLAVHSQPFEDMEGTMAQTYNNFREKYAGRIHFYLQCANSPALVFKGSYHAIIGIFGRHLKNNEGLIWSNFSLRKNPDLLVKNWNCFMSHCAPSPSLEESVVLEKLALDFFKYHEKNDYNTQENKEILDNFIHQHHKHKVVLVIESLENLTSELFFK